MQHQKWKKIAEIDKSGLADNARAIATRIQQVDLSVFKTPRNVHYANYEPERDFSDLLFEHAHLFDGFMNMPTRGLSQVLVVSGCQRITFPSVFGQLRGIAFRL